MAYASRLYPRAKPRGFTLHWIRHKRSHYGIVEQVETTQTGLDIQGVQQIKGLINKCILEKIGKFIQIG